MSTTNAALVPKPEPGESPDVSWALESARTQWEKGNAQEALRWMSRAADAAEMAGDDERALKLARCIADIRETLDSTTSGSVPPHSGAVAVARAPTRTRPPPAPSSRHASATRTPVPRPPSEGPARSPEGTDDSTVQHTAPAEPAKATIPSPTPESRPSNGVELKPPSASEEPVRVRVSVKASVRDPNLFLVRVLPPKKKPPHGTHEATLEIEGDANDLLSIGR